MSAFSTFNEQHILSIFIIVLGMVTIPALVRYVNSKSFTNIATISLAGILLLIKIGEPFFRILTNREWLTQLPLQLCDVGAIVIGLFLLYRKTVLFELGYFWGLGGGIQALLTPDLKYGFPDINFIFYFITHGLCLVAVMYAIMVLKCRPMARSIWRTYFITIIYALIIFPVNWLLKTNYLYLIHKPMAGSLLDYLGSWPWYILSLLLVSLVFFLIYYSPFFIYDITGQRRIKESN